MSVRGQRACMICSVVLPATTFTRDGCPNCEHFLEMRGSSETMQECTSAVFEGTIALARPAESWMAKWQRLQGYVPGIYATKVVGQLSEDAITAAENAGVKYIPYVRFEEWK